MVDTNEEETALIGFHGDIGDNKLHHKRGN